MVAQHIIGFTGEISVTIEFKDIRFGGDGVDIHISLAAFMEARIFGARIQILTIDAGPMVIRNVVQLPSLGQSFEEGATEAKAEDETVPDCVNVRVGSHVSSCPHLIRGTWQKCTLRSLTQLC